MNLPTYVDNILEKLEQAGFEAFVVGGCVRDILRGKEPKDWDVTTNARPEDMLKIFENGKYNNNFGTVLVPIKNEEGETEDVVEVTTYRSESGYSDRRHPDDVVFEDKLEKDLERRDFTINAMAMDRSGKLVDLFGGEKDIKKTIIRAVGEPVDRFKEDALRMMRAVRLACELSYCLEEKTERAILKMAGNIKFIAKERIRDEFVKIIASNLPYDGIKWLYNLKLLQYIIPELERGVGVKQNHHHIHTVFNHSVLSLMHCPSKDWRVRFAALMHDIAKPQTKKIMKGDATFYNHDVVGARVTSKVMRRMKFSNDDIEKVSGLIRNHMFYYNVGEVTESSVRRLIKKVGTDNLRDLIDLRIADRLGSGVPKAKPYKLRHLEYMMKKVQSDPVSVKMLAVRGDDLMRELALEPSPKIGAILDVLLMQVIEDPKLNTSEYLLKEAKQLNESNLEELRAKAKDTIEERKMEDDEELKKEFYVK